MPYIGRELDSGNYLKLDDISSSFNGSTTTFNLTAAGKAFFPASSFSILVVLSGVIQEPNSAYQTSNSQITFASAPASGAEFYCIVLGVAHGVNVPANGTVDGAKLAGGFNYDGYFYLDDTNNRVGVGTATPAKPLHVVGEGQFDSVRVLGDLTVDGTTTTLDTVVTEVDRLEVGANNNTVAIAVTQSGSGDAAHFIGGNVGIGTDNPTASLQINSATPKVILRDDDNAADISVASIGGAAVYSAAADIIFQTANTSEKVRITSAGNVGVGVGTPFGKLHVKAGTDANFSFTTGGGESSFEILNDAGSANVPLNVRASEYKIKIQGTEKLRIDTAGKVGIGTILPQSQFEVFGSSPVIRSKNTNQAYTQINHNGTDGYVDWSTGGLILRGASNTERVRIASNGMVGIGTDAAQITSSERLSVLGVSVLRNDSASSGTLYLRNADFSNANNPYLVLQDGSGNRGAVGIANNDSAMYIHGQTGIRFRYNGGQPGATEAMRISSAGNIGIGTDSPGQKLTVQGTTSLMATNSTNQWMAYTYTDNTFRLNYNGAGSDEITITSDGKVIATQSSSNIALELHATGSGNGSQIKLHNDHGVQYVGTSGDTSGNLIIWQESNADILLSTNNTERLRVDSTGKLISQSTHSNGAVNEALRITTTGTYSSSNSIDAGPAISFGQFHGDYPTWTTAQIAGIRKGNNWDGALTFYTNSGSSETDISEKLRIDSLGNMGLGSASPNNYTNYTTLTINGTSGGEIDFERNGTLSADLFSNSGGFYFSTREASNRPIVWQLHNGTSVGERMRLTGDGKLGIADNAPTRTLSVNGNMNLASGSRIESYSSSGSLIVQGGSTYPGGHLILYGGTGDDMITFNTTGGAATSIERMRLTSDGHLSIGTTTPPSNAELCIRGANPEVCLQADANYSSYLMMGDTADYDNGYIEYDNYSASKGFKFIVGTTKRLDMSVSKVALSQGMGVEIDGGTSNQGTDATVQITKTNNNDWALKVNINNSSSTEYGAYVRANPSSTYALGVNDSSNWTFYVTGAGTIHAVNTSIQSISDVRLKENIVDANSQWDDIKALRFRNYNWNEDSGRNDGKTYLGLIAQEVEPISPGLVEINAQTKEDKENGVPDPEHKNVKYSVVWMKAMKALQEAMERIEVLEAEVKALKGS